MRRLIAIVGPTAVGKSALALDLAQACGGEIVGADSRQVYRYMDIGTAKPTTEQRSLVRHHLIDVVDPDEDFTLATYQEMTFSTIGDIQRRGKTPLLVGGSGLYVRSVVSGLIIPQVAPDAVLRRRLEKKVEQQGKGTLYSELLQVDPGAAASIDPRNVRRVIRALEVYYTTGRPISELRRGRRRFQTLTIGLTTSREDLYRRIDMRVERMTQQGLISEVEGLLQRGYSPELPSMSGVGYRQVIQHLQGEISLDEAVQRIKYDTHRYARHQYAWFRLSDTSIRWFDMNKCVKDDINRIVERFARGQEPEPTGRLVKI